MKPKKDKLFYKTVLIFLIIFSAFVENYSITFFNASFNFQRALGLVILPFLLLLIVGEQRLRGLNFVSLILLIWLVFGFISSLLSVVSEWSLRMHVSLVAVASFFFLIQYFKINPLSFFHSRLFTFFIWFLGPFLVICYFVIYFGIPVPDFILHWFQEGSGGLRIRGTFLEANLYGAYLPFFILIFYALSVNKSSLDWFLIFALHVGLILSFSRVPWVAYIVALFIFLILTHPRIYSIRAIAMKFSLVVLSLVLLISISYFIYLQFGDNEIIGRTHSLSTRLIMWNLALTSMSENLLIGNGTFSFSALFPFAPSLVGSDSDHSAWISNLILAILHDGGVIGALVFFSFVLIIMVKGWKVTRKIAVSSEARLIETRLGAALVASLVGLLISSMTIPSHSLALFWVVLALLQRFVTIYKR